MSIFKQLNESAVGTVEEQLKDFSGGGFISEAGIYKLNIHRAWGFESSGGAIGIHIEFNGEGMVEQDLYITNKNKDTFYVDGKGKKQNMPAYSMVKKINYIATDDFATSLASIKTESRIVKTKEWKEVNGERKQVEVEKEVDFITEWQGKPIVVAFQEIEAKDKDGNIIKNKDGEVITNLEIINVYNSELLSASEAYKGDTEGKAYEADKKRLEANPVRKSKGSKTSPYASDNKPKTKVNPFA